MGASIAKNTGAKACQLWAVAHSIDFRAVYANVLARCLGTTSLSAVLPGHSGAMVDVVA